MVGRCFALFGVGFGIMLRKNKINDPKGETMENFKTVDRIHDLKKKRHAIILAHNYQLPRNPRHRRLCRRLLGLSQQVAKTDAEVIVFCVDFIAETAALLSPTRRSCCLRPMQAVPWRRR